MIDRELEDEGAAAAVFFSMSKYFIRFSDVESSLFLAGLSPDLPLCPPGGGDYHGVRRESEVRDGEIAVFGDGMMISTPMRASVPSAGENLCKANWIRLPPPRVLRPQRAPPARHLPPPRGTLPANGATLPASSLPAKDSAAVCTGSWPALYACCRRFS